jgi:hypothetical protein
MDSLTAAFELREARLTLGLSQGRVARDTGVSRSQLSLFEVRKYLLDRGKLDTLRRYYAKRGYRFDDPAKKSRLINPPLQAAASAATAVGLYDVDVLDGFAVAGAIERPRAEAWLNQIAANDEVIQDLLTAPAPTDLWTGDPKTDKRDEALLQMAHNYALVRRLHGKEIVPPPRSAKDKTRLTADLVRELFWGKDHSDNAPALAKGIFSTRRKRTAKR